MAAKRTHRWLIVPAVAIVVSGIVMYSLWHKDAGDAIRIGVIYAGTGPASFAGVPEQRVLSLLEKANSQAPSASRRIVLDMRDSGGSQDKAIAFLEQFAKDPRCVAVIGPTASGESIAVAAKVLELEAGQRLPVLSLAASSKVVQNPRDPMLPNEWVFKFAQNDDLAAKKLARVIRDEIGDGTVTFLHSDDGFGKSGADVFPAAAAELGMWNKGKALISFPANLSDPNQILTAIESVPDAVIIWGSAPGPAQLVKTLRKQMPKTRIFLSHGNASQEFIDSVGTSGNGVVVVGSRVLMPRAALDTSHPRDRQIIEFQEFWESATHGPQSHFAGHAYDAFELLRTRINEGYATRSAIRGAIESGPPFHGITGTFRFTEKDHAGLDLSAFEVFRIVDDHFEPYSRDAVAPAK